MYSQSEFHSIFSSDWLCRGWIWNITRKFIVCLVRDVRSKYFSRNSPYSYRIWNRHRCRRGSGARFLKWKIQKISFSKFKVKLNFYFNWNNWILSKIEANLYILMFRKPTTDINLHRDETNWRLFESPSRRCLENSTTEIFTQPAHHLENRSFHLRFEIRFYRSHKLWVLGELSCE